MYGKRQRIDSEYNSADLLPTVMDEKMAIVPDTISKEFNKSDLIRGLYNEDPFSLMNLPSGDEYTRFMELVETKSHG